MRPTFFATPAEFRAWFEAHHQSAKELLVGFYKRGSGKPSITWPESVDEALCFGWIDGVRKSVDEDAYTIRFTPRKRTSIWSAINVAKVAALETLGRMTPAGRRAFEARTPERTGVYSFERNSAAELRADEEQKLRADAKATAFFDSQPPWYRRTSIHWVISAKREETRRRRLDQLIADSAQGRTIGPLTRKPESAGGKVTRGKSTESIPAQARSAPRAKRARTAPRAAAQPLARGKKAAAGKARNARAAASARSTKKKR
jgi:uncharacterized protein YdeI (YjbR/CyaY-like superfamily)